MSDKKNNVTLSLSIEEENDLKDISKHILGKSDKTGMVRYWINQAKKEYINQIEVKV